MNSSVGDRNEAEMAAPDRHTILIGGFSPETGSEIHALFARDLVRFDGTWGTRSRAGDLEEARDASRWQVESRCGERSMASSVVQMAWESVVRDLSRRSHAERFARYVHSVASFVLTGTAWRYARANRRYFLFFLYPILVTLAIVAAATVLAMIASRIAGPAAGVVVAVASAVGLYALAVRRLHLGILYDDWIYAHQLARGRAAGAEAIVASIAAQIDRAANDQAATGAEIVVIAHSFGAILAIMALAQWQRAGAGLSRTTVHFLTVGSSLLKVALHPAAVSLRADTQLVAGSGMVWVDVQARSDAMNFFGARPLRALDLAGPEPHILKVSIQKMLTRERYRRLRFNLYKKHRQFIRANDRRSPYDYFMFACGPWPTASMIPRIPDALLHAPAQQPLSSQTQSQPKDRP